MMTEDDIIKGVKRNNRKAQRMLFEKYKRLWFSICLRYNDNPYDAEDALQNALINIYVKVKQFNPKKGSFQSWSSRIVVNENLMLLRKNMQSFDTDPILDDIDALDENETPVERISAEELTKLINKLPTGYRVVFNLYAIEGYSHEEIAEMLKISSGTSKSQLFKARKLLQKKLELMI